MEAVITSETSVMIWWNSSLTNSFLWWRVVFSLRLEADSHFVILDALITQTNFFCGSFAFYFNLLKIMEINLRSRRSVSVGLAMYVCLSVRQSSVYYVTKAAERGNCTDCIFMLYFYNSRGLPNWNVINYMWLGYVSPPFKYFPNQNSIRILHFLFFFPTFPAHLKFINFTFVLILFVLSFVAPYTGVIGPQLT